MKFFISTMSVLAMLIWGVWGWTAEQPPLRPAQEEPEALTSGPVNEAFAQPVTLENQAGMVVSKKPPPDIDEVPPSERPAGDRYIWVPGYWGWDPSRDGFIWVSGCWRAAPPGMYWVAGYWMPVADRWQWVAGFWSPAGDGEIRYLPEPPALTDVEPPGPAPGPDVIWVPPCWYWNAGRYTLRPGYWLRANPEWIWVPSHYLWTPRGYVFIAGYWDYPLSRRGVLFAPLLFPMPYYLRPGVSFSLSIVVDLANPEFGYFAYPRYCHYFFGDYYGESYRRIGLYPWFECTRRHTWYDPIYVHRRWRHIRSEPRWETQERNRYERRLADKRFRPPRTYRQMESRMVKLSPSRRRSLRLAEPINTMVAGKTVNAMKFERIQGTTRHRLTKRSAEMRSFTKQRRRWEGKGPAARTNRPTAERISPAFRNEAASSTTGGERYERTRPRREKVSPAPGGPRQPRIAPTAPRQHPRRHNELRHGRSPARVPDQQGRRPGTNRPQNPEWPPQRGK